MPAPRLPALLVLVATSTCGGGSIGAPGSTGEPGSPATTPLGAEIYIPPTDAPDRLVAKLNLVDGAPHDDLEN